MTDFPDLNARQLRAIVALAEYRSFVAASAALGMSQPGLTRQIRSVEEALGVELFSRSTRRVALTAAGREFAALAERILGDLRLGVEGVRGLAEEAPVQLVVSSVFSLTKPEFGELLPGFAMSCPKVEFHLREGLHDTVVDEVASGLADVGVAYVDNLPQSFLSQLIGPEPLYLVSLPSEARSEISLAELAGQSLVSFPATSYTRRRIDAAAAAAGLKLRYAMTTNRHAALLDLVRGGVGAAIVPRHERPMRQGDLASTVIVGAGPDAQLGAFRLRDRPLSTAGSNLFDHIVTTLRRAGDGAAQ